jgi:hypothetical protein
VAYLPGTCNLQFYAYDAWLTIASGSYDAALFIDLDEYAVFHGRKAGEIAETMSPKTFSLSLCWSFFGSKIDSSIPPVDDSSLARRFTWRAKTCNRHVKPFVMLSSIRNYKPTLLPFFVNPHFVHAITEDRRIAHITSLTPVGEKMNGPYSASPYDPAKFPYIAHYYAKTPEEFEKKISRGRADEAPDGSKQYFKIRDEILKTREEYDLNEVQDLELHDIAMCLNNII